MMVNKKHVGYLKFYFQLKPQTVSLCNLAEEKDDLRHLWFRPECLNSFTLEFPISERSLLISCPTFLTSLISFHIYHIIIKVRHCSMSEAEPSHQSLKPALNYSLI